MPPRRTNSHKAASRRGPSASRPDRTEITGKEVKPLPDEAEGVGERTEAWKAPPGKMSRESPRYETGSDYEAADDDEQQNVSTGDFEELPADGEEEGEEPKSDEFLGDEALPSSFSKDRDIYGEDDLPPEDDEFAPVADGGFNRPTEKTSPKRPPATPQRTGETRVAPLDEEAAAEELPPDSPDATRAGPPLKLEAIAGPDSGKVKQFRGVRMVIGRTPGCDWKLLDASASRKHCEIVVGDGGVLLRDLGSGNGTKVNGQKITEHKLEHGDEIAIGKTVIRFIDEIAAFRKARDEEEQKAKEAEAAKKIADAATEERKPQSGGEAEAVPRAPDNQLNVATAQLGMKARRRTDEVPPPTSDNKYVAMWQALDQKQRYAVMGGVGGVFLLLLLLIAFSGGKEPVPVVDAKVAKASALMQRAQKLVKEEKYEEAGKLAAEAERLVPGSDSDGLAERAQQEAQALAQLADARKLYADGRFDEAKVALGRISFVSNKGADEKKKLQAEIEAGMLNWLKGQADTALRMRDVESARGIVSRLPVSMQQEFNPRIAALDAELQGEAAAEDRKGKKATSDRKKQVVTQRKEYVERAFDPVARKFAAGEFQRAALECDRVADQYRSDGAIRDRASELKRLIPAFAKAFEDGQRKYKAGSLEASARPLRKARDLYNQIGFEGSLGKVIDEELASASFSAATSSYAREDYASAAQYYRETLRLSPGDERAKDGLTRVSKRVEELYLQAYMIRDREPKEAISKLKQVIAASEGTPLQKKAQDLLTSLQ